MISVYIEENTNESIKNTLANLNDLNFCAEGIPFDLAILEDKSELSAMNDLINRRGRGFIYYDPFDFQTDFMRSYSLIKGENHYFTEPTRALFPYGTNAEITANFKTAHDKDSLLSQLIPFFGEMPFNWQKQALKALVDELFMNAIYDGPKEKKQQRSNEENLNHSFTLAHNREWVMVSCRDEFGSLDVIKFLHRLILALTHGPGKVINLIETKGGAGIGCHILHHHSSALILGVKPGEVTRVTALFPFNLNYKSFCEMKKSFQILGDFSLES